jgi:hypothetical protein
MGSSSEQPRTEGPKGGVLPHGDKTGREKPLGAPPCHCPPQHGISRFDIHTARQDNDQRFCKAPDCQIHRRELNEGDKGPRGSAVFVSSFFFSFFYYLFFFC